MGVAPHKLRIGRRAGGKIGRKIGHMIGRMRPELIQQPRLVHQTPQTAAQIFRIVGLKEQPIAPIPDDLRQGTVPGGQHRQAGLERLTSHQRERLLTNRGHHTHVMLGQNGRQLGPLVRAAQSDRDGPLVQPGRSPA